MGCVYGNSGEVEGEVGELLEIEGLGMRCSSPARTNIVEEIVAVRVVRR